MKNFSNTQKILVITIVLAMVSLGLYGFLFWQVRSENQEASQLLGEAEQDVEKEKTLRAAKISLEKNKQFIEKIDTYFVPKDGVVGFIQELETIGKQTGVSLTIGGVTAESDQRTKDDFKETLRIRLETSGSWEKTFYFLSVLESLPYRAQVEQIALSLYGASDKLLFGTETKRVRGKDEVWKGVFEITVLKLK